MTLLGVLYWLGLAGAAAAVVLYFVQIAMLRKTVRVVSGAGLFFTGVGLAEAAIAMHAGGPDASRATPGAIAVAALLIAVYFQAVSALRTRRDRTDNTGQAGGAA
ncbi:MAG TPA: hypothetical protein VGG68_14330 [Caulobacteraceae bacterium]|jgi:hypothetical protein